MRLLGGVTGSGAWRAALLAGATPAAAAAQTAGREAWQAPTLTNVRYDEHLDRAVRDDRWTARFKRIPLADGAYLVTGLEVRARYEGFRGNWWGSAAAPDDGYLWLRALPYADVHADDGAVGVRAFVQPVAAYAAGVAPAPGPVDRTRTDLLQGFADVRVGAATGDAGGYGVTMRAGRQMMSLGTERLVGTRYGPNVPLAFDGLRTLVSLKGATVSLFALRPVEPGGRDFDDRPSRTRRLRGVYATLPHIGLASGLDLYWIGFQNAAATFGGIDGRERRGSVGARLFGASAGWHWNVEGVVQRGRFGAGRIAAWTLGSEAGRAFADAALAPEVTMRLNIVSGDGDAGDDRLGTFNAPFPRGKYFGELSPVGPANIVSLNPRVDLTLAPGLSAGIAAMAYWRASRGDGVYDITGTAIRDAGGSRARSIGRQVEATLARQVTPELELSASLSLFAPGAFVRDTGPVRTIAMLGTEVNFRF